MAKEVILTPLAIANYDRILEYLTYKWGASAANNFIERFQNVLESLEKNPQRFAFENKVKRIQKCVLTKHNILYFKESEEAIKIITIFDTRQNPEKLSSLI